MARRITANSKWNLVNIPSDLSYDPNFENLIEIKELTDYKISSFKEGSKKRKKSTTESEKIDFEQKLKGKKNKHSCKNNDHSEKNEHSKNIYNKNISITKDKVNLEHKLIINKKESKVKIKKNLVSDSQSEFSVKNILDLENKLPIKKSKIKLNKNCCQNFEVDSEPLDMGNWLNMHISEKILLALADLNFTKPTPIQSQALPYAIRDRADIIGAAQTGSGKTLAFVIPIIQHILDEVNNNLDSKNLHSVIITPTRELAIQIRDHFEAIAQYTDIKCVAIVGGMSIEKQNRLLGYKPKVIVATPGRLWEMIVQRHEHLEHINKLKCLVIDEADRLIQEGHYKELTQILNVINNSEQNKLLRQNFIYSATLTFVHDKPKRSNPKKLKKIKENLDDKLTTITNLIGLRSKYYLIDLTIKNQMTDHLKEFKLKCTFDEKDIYLYYLIKHAPCRRIVFTNSKDSVRRVSNILEVLDCKAFPLHADMQQKQRLKHLDQFREIENSVLIATDVAARGLDITDIQQVIHYHIPKTTEMYVHRSGRTARSDKTGTSVAFVSPEEVMAFKKILSSLKRTDEPSLIEIDLKNYSTCKSIVKLAIQIEKEEHSDSKYEAKNRWFKQAALDAELESSHSQSESDEEEILSKNLIKSRLKEMRSQLSFMLKQKQKTKE